LREKECVCAFLYITQELKAEQQQNDVLLCKHIAILRAAAPLAPYRLALEVCVYREIGRERKELERE